MCPVRILCVVLTDVLVSSVNDSTDTTDNQGNLLETVISTSQRSKWTLHGQQIERRTRNAGQGRLRREAKQEALSARSQRRELPITRDRSADHCEFCTSIPLPGFLRRFALIGGICRSRTDLEVAPASRREKQLALAAILALAMAGGWLALGISR
jgi:hypothetical protein